MVRVICVGMILVSVSLAQADDSVKVRVEKAAPPVELKEGFQKLLEDAGHVILDGDQTIATIWFRKTLPSQAAPEQIKGGLTYREIPETTLIGVIQLPQVWVDYRNQRIAAGVYTLRIAFQPQTGDHMGTAPYTEFCLLTPVAKDAKPDPMEPKELHELSANATGSSHPSPMLLFPCIKPEDQPKVESKPSSTWVLFIKRPVDANGTKTSLGFGLVVKGHSIQQ